MARREDDPLVLVVEDDPAIQRLISLALAPRHIGVDVRKNGAEAVQNVGGKRPDAVLLDVHLPDIDGIAVAGHLRQRWGPELPIVVMTAGAQAARVANQVGAFAYLSKPFDIQRLEEVVRQAVLSVRGGKPAGIR